jgi:hypothetical protein
MKKWAIGCGIALLVVLIAAGGVGYYLYTKAQPFVASIRQFAAMAEVEKQVANRSPYTPPSNGELSEDQVARFVKVEEHIKAGLGARDAELKAKYDQLDRLQKTEHRQANFAEAMMALRDLSGILLDGKRAQVEALNQVNFSLEEYRWVRGQVYAAAGMSLAEIDFADIQKAAQAGGRDLEMKQVTSQGEVPERNKELVKPYLAKLQEWVGLGFFGL